MKTNGPLVFCGIFAGVFALFIAYKTFVVVPERIVNSLSSALLSLFQDKITINVQNDTLGVTPVAELALADVRVRSIVDYVKVENLSQKHMIAHQSFDVKIGWDMKDDINIVTDQATRSVKLHAKSPHLLSVMHIEKVPVILLQEDGMFNKLTPDDMIEVQRRLELYARSDDAVKAGREMALLQIQQYFTGLFKMQNYTVTFEFDGAKSLE